MDCHSEALLCSALPPHLPAESVHLTPISDHSNYPYPAALTRDGEYWWRRIGKYLGKLVPIWLDCKWSKQSYYVSPGQAVFYSLKEFQVWGNRNLIIPNRGRHLFVQRGKGWHQGWALLRSCCQTHTAVHICTHLWFSPQRDAVSLVWGLSFCLYKSCDQRRFKGLRNVFYSGSKENHLWPVLLSTWTCWIHGFVKCALLWGLLFMCNMLKRFCMVPVVPNSLDTMSQG